MVRISRLIFHNLCNLIVRFDISVFLHDHFLALNATNLKPNFIIDCSYLFFYIWKQTLRKRLFQFRMICLKRSEVMFSMPSYWRLGFVLFVFANRNKKYLHAEKFSFSYHFFCPRYQWSNKFFTLMNLTVTIE